MTNAHDAATRHTAEVEACLARVRRGDDGAGNELVELLYPQVIRIARAHLPRAMSEEDLAQEVFMKIFAKLDQFRGDTAPFEHWIARIAHNTCLDFLRMQKRRPELRYADLEENEVEVLMNEHSIRERTHEAAPEELAAREILEKLFATLSPADQMILRMLDLQQLAVAEICQQTGWNASLIKVRAWRARRKLQATCRKLQAEGQL
ncbi:RNA polymerase subunit sigma-24 [Verrucomicrobia bacterium LW23]|nr:RNA polymerase subunit sigma-24 [Verrucomicrobia bacterium LW23]